MKEDFNYSEEYDQGMTSPDKNRESLNDEDAREPHHVVDPSECAEEEDEQVKPILSPERNPKKIQR